MTQVYLMTSSELYDNENLIIIQNSDSKQEIIEKEDKITRLKQNEKGDYEANLGEGVKLTLNNDGAEELAPTGYASSGMLSALIAFVCGLGFGLAYIISHLD